MYVVPRWYIASPVVAVSYIATYVMIFVAIGGDYVDVSLNAEGPTKDITVLSTYGRRMSQPHHRVAEPFPELSASSEEDVSMRSGASSFSSSKSTSSSRSSLAREDNQRSHAHRKASGFPMQSLDAEPYVDCQQSSFKKPHAVSLMTSSKVGKPERVTSFIAEEPMSSSKHSKKRHSHNRDGRSSDSLSSVRAAHSLLSPLERRSSKSSLASVSSTPRSPSVEVPVADPYAEMIATVHADPLADRRVTNMADSYMTMAPAGDEAPQVKPSAAAGIDSYMQMAPGESGQPRSAVGETQSEISEHSSAKTLDSCRRANATLPESSYQPSQADDSYMDMLPHQPPVSLNHKLDDAGGRPVTASNPYMEMNLDSGKQQQQEVLVTESAASSAAPSASPSAAPSAAPSATPLAAPSAASAPPSLPVLKPLPKVDVHNIPSHNSHSDLSTLGSDVTDVTSVTNSSSDSNTTVIDDSYPTVSLPDNRRQVGLPFRQYSTLCITKSFM